MKRKKGFKIVRIIIIFLVIVIAGTVMSRFASNTLTPKVEIMYASSGSISRDVVQDVMIESDSRTPVYSYPDLLVQAIYVHTGSYVKKGDKLMKIKAEELSSTYLTKKLERKNLKEQYVYAWGDERALVEANIADVDRQLNYLEKLTANEGVIYSEVEGLVSEIRVDVGSRTTEEAAFVVMESSDEYTVRIPVTSEQKSYIEKGDKVILHINDTSVNTEVTAVYSDATNEQGHIVETVISGELVNVGDSVLADISHQSEKYDFVVPVSAIYADVVGSYVLVERSKDTILGTELVAAKVYVTVGDTNNYEVGIKKSSLTGDDRIIASSDKKIEAGDTVREK
ncbi:hypothetical protein G4313_10905 [Coprococcus eutactus]|jgi:multidrug efflux pump subunit AcrA (membrane-fusion protein)|uniref:Efflux RND transporter periplasmic adaptor subunit n=1 Tax=Coprococcus ammoniilyticus TaxID=2981785 RepID=A0ABV1EK45_9FIRM|nr:efflux RND transporter periplasmic adaptor subunit [Coprococcus ammoniilyticus]MCU6729723.1 efflux RND transporter periplasmic adaptor subunit [Coprococcus ammoniilyticus]NSE53530.1 hypothetical protein [Coprococcus eutactus]SCH00833.1 efflux transporter%2C RND family%2C MFP subunit [uncultured Coprococcus sp.]